MREGEGGREGDREREGERETEREREREGEGETGRSLTMLWKGMFILGDAVPIGCLFVMMLPNWMYSVFVQILAGQVL